MATQQDRKPDISVGIDLGTAFTAVTIWIGAQLIRMTFAGTGKTMPSQVYRQDDGQTLIGVQARNASLKDPAKLYKAYKRQFPGAPDQPFNGGPTSTELTLAFLKALWCMILDIAPDIRPYIDGTEDREKLSISVTCPATYGTEAQQRLVAIGNQVGFGFRVDQLIPEPVAAVQNFRESLPEGFQQGDKVVVVDVGDGTTDCTMMEFNQGKFDQLIGGKGNARLGGGDFSGRIYVTFAKEHLPEAVACFDAKGGFSVANVSLDPAQRRDAMALWDAAEGMKQRLSGEEEVEEFVTLSTGLVELKVTRSEVSSLFTGGGENLYERVKAAVADVLAGSQWQWNDVKHVFLVGGAAQTIGLAEFVAAASKRRVSEIHVSADSSHAISDGAAFQALHKEAVARCLPGGLAIQVKDDSGQPKSKFFIPTGETVPASGKSVEKMGQFVRSSGGQAMLQMVLNEAKPGVRVDVPPGKTVIVDDQQVVSIKRIRCPVDLPAGDHEVQLGTIIDPNGKLTVTVGFPSLPHLDILRIPITDDRQDDQSIADPGVEKYDIVICLDCSTSMEDEMEQAKDAVYDVLESLGNFDVRVGVVQFGLDTVLTVPLTEDFQRIADGVVDLEAAGSTPMTEALEIAEAHVNERKNQDREVLVILISDGAPDERSSTERMADQLKQNSKLATIAIGPVADKQFLLKLASSPTYFSLAKDVSGLLNAMEQILDFFLDEDAGDDFGDFPDEEDRDAA